MVSTFMGLTFDLFDSTLFTYAAPVCVPYLLGLDPDDPDSARITAMWTSILTSVLLVGWAIGGFIFGIIADKFGRAKALLFTISIYSVSTAICAGSFSIWWLVVFRFISAVGIGGEWAAGASLAAESVQAEKRILASVLVYTGAPTGALVGFVVNAIINVALPAPKYSSYSWRIVFAIAVLPVILTLLIRLKVKEPERWKTSKSDGVLTDALHQPWFPRVICCLVLSCGALIVWWSIQAFIPYLSSYLSNGDTKRKSDYVIMMSVLIYSGGIIGSLSVFFIAKFMQRKKLFLLFFSGETLSPILCCHDSCYFFAG
ncbi:MFS transporter [Pelomyxa schiedti]|nr:MFS transporter [Pelomyxa schiedti]